MNLIVVLLLVGAGYIVYTMLQSYRSLEAELREVRKACTHDAAAAPSAVATDPVAKLRDQLVVGLRTLERAAA